MFEISTLKEKKLVELQKVAKAIGIKKISQVKKLDLIYLILDEQAKAPKQAEKPAVKQPRARINKTNSKQVKQTKSKKEVTKIPTLFDEKVKKEKEEPIIEKKEEPVSKQEVKISKQEVLKEQKKRNERANALNPNYKKKNTPNQNGDSKPIQQKPKVKVDKGNELKRHGMYRDPDYEFDGIIEAEGVLETMNDGYGFFTLIRL